MSITNIVINTVDSTAMVLDQLDPQSGSDSSASLQRLARYIDGLGDGAFYYSTVTEDIGATQATATFTVSSTGPTNGQVGTVVNQNLTAETSGADPTMGQFNISATPSVVATGIALAINSFPATNAIVSATSNGAVVTITARHAGNTGNGLEISAGNWSNVVATAFSGGASGTVVVLA